jgi:hypothetical protein
VTAAEGTRFSFEAPGDGWSGGGWLNFLTRGTGVGDTGVVMSAPWSVDGVFTDPCVFEPAPAVGPTAEDLAAAVAGIPGLDATDPVDVSIDGHPGKYVELAVPDTLPCAPNDFNLWWWNEACSDEVPWCNRYATGLNTRIRVWIFDLDGERLWMEAETYEGASPELGQEIQRLVNSIQFE